MYLSKQTLMKKIAIYFCVIIAVTGFSINSFAANKFEKEVEKEKGAIKLAREIKRGMYDIVSTEELNTWIKAKKDIIIIDTMPYAGSFVKGHIPGAKQFLFPIPEMTDWDVTQTDGKTLEDFKKLLGPDKNKTVVIYCGFVKCTRSHNGAAWAKKLGYTNVFRQPGGIFAWKGAGYEVAQIKK